MLAVCITTHSLTPRCDACDRRRRRPAHQPTTSTYGSLPWRRPPSSPCCKPAQWWAAMGTAAPRLRQLLPLLMVLQPLARRRGKQSRKRRRSHNGPPSGAGVAAGSMGSTPCPLAGARLLAAAGLSLQRKQPWQVATRQLQAPQLEAPRQQRQQQQQAPRRQQQQCQVASQGLPASAWVALPWRLPQCSGRCNAC